MKISILGCGWLGLSLAKSLIEKGFLVKGSTTSLEKISILKNTKIIPFHIQLNENEIIGNIDLFLENSEVLIINIPPKLRGNLTENFISKIKNIIPFIEKSEIKKVVFISSTSVYEDVLLENGKPKEFDEFSETNPETVSGKQLLEVENILLSNPNFDTIVIRFGGLIGDDRHPIKMLSGKKNIQNPNAPINLIHLKDCIAIIEKISKTYLKKNEIFNAVTPFHQTRKGFYTQKALELGLPLPEFDTTKPSVGKLILSEKVEKLLGYQFKEKQL